MKILQINNVFGRKSTGKIVSDIHGYLQKTGHKSIVCYGRGPKVSMAGVYKVCNEIEAKINALYTRFFGLQYSFAPLATKRLFNIIESEKPDIVHLQCINGYFVDIYQLLDFLKKKQIKVVVTLHAEFMYTGSCGYAFDCDRWKTGCGQCPQLWNATKSFFLDRTEEAWKRMKAAFYGFTQENMRVVSVSSWVDERAKQSPILKDQGSLIIENGIDTNGTFFPREYRDLKIKHGISSEKVILHVTASFMSPIKGGAYVLELAKRMRKDKVKFLVVGYNGADGTTLPDNIIPIPHTDDQKQLAQYYSMADLTLLTSKKETFSMPCAESLSCGTPVVGFKAGGPERISLEEYSEFVDHGDMDELERTVIRWINRKQEISAELSKIASTYYSDMRMCERYIQVYKNLGVE